MENHTGGRDHKTDQLRERGGFWFFPIGGRTKPGQYECLEQCPIGVALNAGECSPSEEGCDEGEQDEGGVQATLGNTLRDGGVR